MKLLKANALLFQWHYPIAMTTPVGYIRFEREAPLCVSFLFLPVGSYPASLFLSRSSIRTQSHAYANLFCRCISERDVRLCCVHACICVYVHALVRWHIAWRVYAYMLWRRAVVQTDRGGEGHKLNDVNALSTLCRCERRRHTELPSRVYRPSRLVTASAIPHIPPTLTIIPLPLALTLLTLLTDYNYRDLHFDPVSFVCTKKKQARKHYLSTLFVFFSRNV